MYTKLGYALKNLVEGLSDEVYYPWESAKKKLPKAVTLTIATKQNKVLIHQIILSYIFFKVMENKPKVI